jgi:hypothetical protein
MTTQIKGGQVLDLRDDEYDMLLTSVRCEGCGHLAVLHNGHCCSFCTVAKCPCTKDGYKG